jgi:hypothetical protein
MIFIFKNKIRYKSILQDETASTNEVNSARASQTLPANRKLTATIIKSCKLCKQSVFNKRYITFENGEIICHQCHETTLKESLPPRVKSAHLILCSICQRTVKGSRYITEEDGTIVCSQCDASGSRCLKCNRLFKHDEQARIIQTATSSLPLMYHNECFACANCSKNIESNNYFQTAESRGLPICSACFEFNKKFRINKEELSQSSGHETKLNQIENTSNNLIQCGECSNYFNQSEEGFFTNADGLSMCSNCNNMQLLYATIKCSKCRASITNVTINFNKYYLLLLFFSN